MAQIFTSLPLEGEADQFVPEIVNAAFSIGHFVSDGLLQQKIGVGNSLCICICPLFSWQSPLLLNAFDCLQ